MNFVGAKDAAHDENGVVTLCECRLLLLFADSFEL
jgi:hypothetical protein